MALFPIFPVTIERSNNARIAVEVPDYEIKILKALHGEYSVEVGEAALFEEERPDSAHEIYEGLKNKYNNKSTGDVVSAVYRSAEELSSAAKLDVGKAVKKAESLQEDKRGVKAAGAKSANVTKTKTKAAEAVQAAEDSVAEAKADAE